MSTGPDSHNHNDHKKTPGVAHTALTLAVIFLGIILVSTVLQKTVSDVISLSHTLADANWNALFSFGIFAMMIAVAIKIASEPFFRYLKWKKSISHH